MEPLEFRPILKRIRWGGRRLGTLLGKPLGPETDYAESWEVVDHGDDQSLVVAGELAGQSLSRLVRERGPELLGRHAGRTQFPLLAKFLDAHDRLSLQVHPNDEQAVRFDPRENGKTEAWVVVHAEPGSRLFVGLRDGVDRARLAAALRATGPAAEPIESLVHAFVAHAGDCVFVPAGTVHAIGEGLVIAEIQQSSDLTFRLHDWGRVGPDGRPRAVHVEESLACLDFARGPVDAADPIRDPSSPHVERLVRCPFFELDRLTLAGPFDVPLEDRFRLWMCLGGRGTIETHGRRTELATGRTLLLPASLSPSQVASQASPLVILQASLP